MIQLHDKTFVPFISAGDIDAMLNRMVWEVEEDFKDDVPLFIAVLNGAFMVASDFVKKYSYPCEVSFVKLASYQGTESSGEVKNLIGLDQELSGRSIVIIEDIVDTGNTIAELKKILENKNVGQLKIATLFFKPEAYTKDIRLDYIGFEIPDKFIVGYGLDYNELGRNLPEVYQLNTNTL